MKPIRVTVSFPAGESIDATARLIVLQWQTTLGAQMVIDNRGRADGAPRTR